MRFVVRLLLSVHAFVMPLHSIKLQAGSAAAIRTRPAARSHLARRVLCLPVHAAVSASPRSAVKDAGTFSVIGTVRKRNEDRFDLKV